MITRILTAGVVTAVVAPSLTLEAIAFEGLAVAITLYLEQQS